MQLSSWFMVSFILAFSHDSLADFATGEEMAESAQTAHFRSKDETVRGQRIANGRELAFRNAERDPNGIFSATVLFVRGMPVNELAKLATRRNLAIARIEIKVSLADNGTVRTISVGASDIYRISGDQSDQLEFAVGVVRQRLLDRSKIEVGERSEQLRRVAYGEMNIYKVELVATALEINNLNLHKDVVAAIPDNGNQKVVALNIIRENQVLSRQSLFAPL